MKRLLIALCIVLCMASSAFCIDPFKVNEGGFGPKIKGLQLGQKMSLLEIVSWGVTQGKLPFYLNLYKDNVLIEFKGEGTDFKGFNVEKAKGRYFALNNFSGTLGDLLSEIEKLGFNQRDFSFERTEISINDDMRISKLCFSPNDFGAGAMTKKEFAQTFINAYGIPSLDGVGRDEWRYRNISQGWELFIGSYVFGYGVTVAPIVTQSAFD